MAHEVDSATEAVRISRPAEVTMWDLLVRIFHWSVAALFALAWIREDWQFIHQPTGYMILALVGLRVVWGFVGTKHTRFSDFIYRPIAILEHVRSMLSASPSRSLGHNPLGGVTVMALLTLLLATGVSGWLITTHAGCPMDREAARSPDRIAGALNLLANIILAMPMSKTGNVEEITLSALRVIFYAENNSIRLN